MRPIKFRIVDTTFNKVYTTADEIATFAKKEGEDFNSISMINILDGELLGRFSNIIPQQFTGLHDKNGKEMYEGDVVVCRLFSGDLHTYTHPVQFVTHPAPMFAVNGRQMNDAEYAVIGNIYENPELLKYPHKHQ